MDSVKTLLVLLLGLIRSSCCLNCSISQLKADCLNLNLTSVPQELNPNITLLNLNKNQLTELMDNTFERYKELTVLLIDDNNIKSLGENAFLGIGKLEILSMEGNQLDLSIAYPKNVFRHIPYLKSINIRGNNERKIDAVPVIYPYFGFLRELQFMSMDLVEIPVFNTSGLVLCTKLTVLIFYNCFLFNMNNDTLYGMPNNVTSITFIECMYVKGVEADFLKHFPNLQNLTLYKTYIHLSRALQLLFPLKNKTMQLIDIDRVTHKSQDSKKYPAAVTVTREMMKYLKTICVRTLTLPRNGIVDFEPGSLLKFDHPECLETLVFTGNRFSVTSGVKLRDMWILNAALSNIKIFDFSYNPTEFEHVTFLPPNILRPDATLHSNYKQLFDAVYSGKYFINEQKQNNVKFDVTFVLPATLEIIRLSHLLVATELDITLMLHNASNLWYLDVSYFQMHVFPNIFIVGENNLEYLDLSGIDSTLYYKKEKIPLLEKVKTLVMQDAKLYMISAQINNVFRHSPNVEKLDISRNALFIMTEDAFIYNNHLKQLYLQHNLFNDIPIAVTSLPELKVLDVRYNNIQTVNKTLMDWMDRQQETHHNFTLRIWANWFKCTCENVDFVQWIFRTKIHFDGHESDFICRLDNGTEMKVLRVYEEMHELFSKCNSEKWLKIGISLLVAFIICVIPTAIVFNFRWRIAYFIYKQFKLVIEKDIKEKYNYDIYLSYADDSLCWIKNTLLPKIENSWKMNVCNNPLCNNNALCNNI